MFGAFAVERGVRMHNVRRGHVTSLISNGGCHASGGRVWGIGAGMVWVVGVWSGEVMMTGGGGEHMWVWGVVPGVVDMWGMGRRVQGM